MLRSDVQPEAENVLASASACLLLCDLLAAVHRVHKGVANASRLEALPHGSPALFCFWQ